MSTYAVGVFLFHCLLLWFVVVFVFLVMSVVLFC